MTKEEVLEVLEKEKQYMLSHGGDRQAKALEMAIKDIDKYNKIEQIINDWNDVPWGTSRTIMQATLLRIEDVLEKKE